MFSYYVKKLIIILIKMWFNEALKSKNDLMLSTFLTNESFWPTTSVGHF